MTLSITSDDFTNGPLADLGVSVTWYDSTKTKHPVTGVETLTYASGSSITVVFVKRVQRYEQQGEGIVDLGDAAVFAPTTLGLAKDNKILYDGQTYIIMNVIRRNISGTNMFDTCNMVKIL